MSLSETLLHGGWPWEELLLMLWGVLFVVVGTREPRPEGRNFTSTRKRAAESLRVVAIGMRSIASSSRTGRTSSAPVQGPDRNATRSRDKEARLNAQVKKRNLAFQNLCAVPVLFCGIFDFCVLCGV